MSSKIRAFRKRVLHFYSAHGRHNLPWRRTRDPYKILVSEIMLQQTQVDRVLPKYLAFIDTFPTVEALAKAKLSKVLKLWSGLGYNRRARMLHQAAQVITRDYQGAFPRDVGALEKLPGVGPYTARAVSAFAFNKDVVMIETNIRSVFLHEFFKDKVDIPDSEILHLIGVSAEGGNSREWYAALMDYGSHLKKTLPNPSRKSKHHAKQSKFKGSLREVRGGVLSSLLKGSKTTKRLTTETKFSLEKVQKALKGLEADGLVEKDKQLWKVAT